MDNNCHQQSIPQRKIFVHATSSKLGKFYCCAYEDDLTNSEIIRNICVNLRIDPETDNGITKNVTVAIKTDQGENEWSYWNDHILRRAEKFFVKSGDDTFLHLQVEPIER